MKQIFLWNKKDNIITKDLEFSNWQFSEKKNKYYCVIELKQYLVIWFKNWYCIINERPIKQKVDSIRNYYHVIKNWITYKITPHFEMPF
jgi:hypothetical protein